MKSLYNNSITKPERVNASDLVTYNYESRKNASNANYKFVHLYEQRVKDHEEVEYIYYSTLKM